jgi:hypothetical protein
MSSPSILTDLPQNGPFHLLIFEDTPGFEALKQAFLAEHRPVTVTEAILVNAMLESHWLAQRTSRLQDTCIDNVTGAVTNEKHFSLYMRCHSTHMRAFHKSLTALQKLRSEQHKADLGFEAQKMKNEQHEMKKQKHYWDVMKKDLETCRQISLNTMQNIKARAEVPGFEAEYDAQLAKLGLKTDASHVAAQAA